MWAVFPLYSQKFLSEVLEKFGKNNVEKFQKKGKENGHFLHMGEGGHSVVPPLDRKCPKNDQFDEKSVKNLSLATSLFLHFPIPLLP